MLGGEIPEKVERMKGRCSDPQWMKCPMLSNTQHKENILNSNYLRLLIIGKHTPKFLREDLHSSPKVVNLIMSLECQHPRR